MKKMLSCLLALAILLTGAVLPAGLAEDVEHEPVTITYGGNGDYFMLSEWFDAFEAEYPWITVEMARTPSNIPNLTAAAAANQMPDVFHVSDLVTGMQNNWLLDLTPYFEADADSAAYPEWLLAICKDKEGKIRLLGDRIYAELVMVNLSILDEMNVAKPGYDWTIDEWAEVLRATSGTGKSVGIGNLSWFQWYLPAQMGNPDIGYLSFNTATQQWDFGEEWIESATIIKELFDEGVALWDWLDGYIGMPWMMSDKSEEEQNSVWAARDQYLMDSMGTQDWVNYWALGKYSMTTGDSNISWYRNNAAYTGFEWDVYPFPVRNEGDQSRVMASPSLLGVSAATQHPEEAYLLVKWMSYNLDGYASQIGIMNSYDRDEMMVKYPEYEGSEFASTLLSYFAAPSTDPRAQELFQTIEREVELPGLDYLFAHINENPVVNGWRYIPDFDTVDGMFFDTLIYQIYAGSVTPASAAAEYESIANKLLQDAIDFYGN